MRGVRNPARLRSRTTKAGLRSMRGASRADAGAALPSVRRTARIRGQRGGAMRPMPRASPALSNRAHRRALSNHGRGRTRQPARADSPSQVRARSSRRPRAGGLPGRRTAGVGRRLRRGNPGATALAALVVARDSTRPRCSPAKSPGGSIFRWIRPRSRAGASPPRRPRNITTSAQGTCAARSRSPIPNGSEIAAC